MKNYFKLFNLIPSVIIDKEDLHAKYIKLQLIYHPDKWCKNCEVGPIGLICERSMQNLKNISAQINVAYKILLDDVMRIEHLLTLAGIDIGEYASQDLALESFEEYEYLETSDQNKIISYIKRQEEKYENLLRDINVAYNTKRPNIHIMFIRIRFLSKIIEQAQNKLQS